ncbi:2-succinyl-5-enolpyruvyl-6-hydroxy-3-cyclohexene-1-carboxylic-acid synthase [Pedococcus sp. 5OH_020]|uniref:2-succinyl-5-enolpyruvyl-6-hydroxy-3- cyclohexene-1-carboxylic-acid synthase n=1 Tax=Pedococcus sp. 5OH_020 TaxID=2989814 RepID=UPI0022EA0533|nr:2-succinyl-5-enolpyruvyl-6-hydroxy-3-cyclohexene-1-carboxylic-acid synthase [Pedococcus sp. 5OH_020]
MNPSTALATVLVDELVRHGVRHAVLCPGSRSAPLAYALQQADRAGLLTLHVRVDERSAGFLALGLGKLTRVPAVVVTTSGTAVANLHPAVLEAHHGIVPLVVLSADRPPELRGTGANQTTVQPGLFGQALRWSHELAVPERRVGQQAGWRSQVSRAVAAATGATGGDPGPVHLNVPLREPLVPTDEPEWPEPLCGRPDGLPWTAPGAPTPHASAHSSWQPWPSPGTDERLRSRSPSGTAGAGLEDATLVLLGDLPESETGRAALRWASAHGWPVVAEPFGAHPRPEVVPHGALVLAAGEWVREHAPSRVVVVGRLTLSRDVTALLRREGLSVEAVASGAQWSDPSGVVSVVHPRSVLLDVPAAEPERLAGPGWAAAWYEAGRTVAKALANEPPAWPSGPAVASALAAGLPTGATLFLGSSNSVRDFDLAATPTADLTVVANRGLAGIDGCVSTASGLALAGDSGVYALMGDLTFLHDANGLLIGPDEPVPDLTVVVTNDDGGGIFTLLEPGEPQRSADFERIFGTPTGADLAAICRAHGVAHERLESAQHVREAVAAPPSGLRVIEVPVDRSSHRTTRAALRRLAERVLTPGASEGLSRSSRSRLEADPGADPA